MLRVAGSPEVARDGGERGVRRWASVRRTQPEEATDQRVGRQGIAYLPQCHARASQRACLLSENEMFAAGHFQRGAADRPG